MVPIDRLLNLSFLLMIHISLVYSLQTENSADVNNYCDNVLNSDLIKEIAQYRTVVNKITNSAINGNFKNKIWLELTNFVDTFGNRFTGTENLENSIDYMLNLLNDYKLDNVHGENVSVPHWVRGAEKAYLTSPKNYNLDIIGLGFSIGTPKDGIFAEVLVVQSFAELRQRAAEAVDKIVVIVEEWMGYSESVKIRRMAALEVAKVGGVAVLISSVTPYSISRPHTGFMIYQNDIKKIPGAALTVDDAQMILRMSKRGGPPLKMVLYMESVLLPDTVSRNTVAQLTGTSHPEKIVVVSGHLDSWDIGTGALDDADGAFVSWGTLALLKSLGLRPKRTIRAILWTAEEVGLFGAKSYAKDHETDIDNFVVAMESDYGVFTPTGLQYKGSDMGGCIVKEVLKLMSPLNATQFINASHAGSDIMVWADQLPLLELTHSDERYFWFHHTAGDTLTVLDPSDLDKGTALWAASSFVLADISVDLSKIK